MPKIPKEEIRKEGRAEVAPTRPIKKFFSFMHDRATRAFVSVALASSLAACSPATVNAQDTTPEKGKPEVAAVEKKGVTYETIADLSELQPYLDNAKDKLVTLTSRKDVKKLGPYEMWLGNTINNITTFVVVVEGVNKNLGVKIRGPPEDTNIIVLDMGESHPYIKGKMLVFAGAEEVWFVYFDKLKGEYDRAVVDLTKGKMRQGPVQTGIDITSESIAVINFPKNTKPGDVIAQAELASISNETYELGAGYKSFFVYDPKKPAGTLVASLAINY